MSRYTIHLSNTFEADSVADAIAQMAAWASDNAYSAGYRVIDEDTGNESFVDADEINFNESEN